MIFLPLLILGILLYITGHRVLSVLILLFFITSGFQLFPLVLFETHFGISKPLDFGIIYTFFLFIFGLVKYKDFIPKNNITKAIALFLLFIFVSSFVSYYYGHVAISNITRETRYFFFVLIYYIFRRLKHSEIESIFSYLLYIVLFQSILFSLQPIFSHQILNGYAGQGTIDGLPFLRYYNIPLYNSFFIFYILFSQTITKYKKVSFIAILMSAQLFTMHRSQIAILLLLIIVGFLYKYPPRTLFQKLLLSVTILIVLLSGFLSFKSGGKTSNDIQSVIAGDFVEFNVEEVTAEATLVFRLAHFYERMTLAFENKRTAIFGLGFMSEDSKIASKEFDFFVGMEGQSVGDVIQLDTSDIAWSNFVIRLGILGTLLYLIVYIYILFRLSKKKRSSFLGLATWLYLLQIILTSVTSSQLYYTWLLILPILSYIYVLENEHDHEFTSSFNHNTIV